MLFFRYKLYLLYVLLRRKQNMQAYGRYDFNATATDELTFQKGALVKVRSD
jgi:hypothetical protein